MGGNKEERKMPTGMDGWKKERVLCLLMVVCFSALHRPDGKIRVSRKRKLVNNHFLPQGITPYGHRPVQRIERNVIAASRRKFNHLCDFPFLYPLPASLLLSLRFDVHISLSELAGKTIHKLIYNYKYHNGESLARHPLKTLMISSRNRGAIFHHRVAQQI